ncbi:5-oxoprolinase subunit B family protein [Thioclava pacifica]|nr:carboxyltransferase domain-containing protein [Thioclava pacifica]
MSDAPMSDVGPISSPTPELLPAGADGVLVRFALSPDPVAMAAAQGFERALEEAPLAGVIEVAPALVSLLLRFDPVQMRRADLIATLRPMAERAAREAGHLPDPIRRWQIPAAFGGENGPELAPIARALGLNETTAVEQISKADLRVLAIGFFPGQPYLGLLPERWNLPRLPELVPSVPAGAVVVAVRQIVLFGAASATGWRQVARAHFRCFDPARTEPMPLRAGDAIRFVPVSAGELAALDTPDGMGGARLEHLA